MKDHEAFRRFAGSVQIAHHVVGRIRFKLGEIELDAEGRALLADARRFHSALDALPGIKTIKLNLLARSCTVEYDPTVIPCRAWPDLLAGKDSAEAATLICLVATKYAELAHAEP